MRGSDSPAVLEWSGVEFVKRLAALIPPPRKHLVRYYGALSLPVSCASLMMKKPARSLTEPPGLAHSALATILIASEAYHIAICLTQSVKY